MICQEICIIIRYDATTKYKLCQTISDRHCGNSEFTTVRKEVCTPCHTVTRFSPYSSHNDSSEEEHQTIACIWYIAENTSHVSDMPHSLST